MLTEQLTICVIIIYVAVFEVCRFRHKLRDGFEGRSSANIAGKDLLYPFKKDSFLKLEIARYFQNKKTKDNKLDIILVRHGQTQSNLQNLLSSLPDLSNEGSFSLVNKNETIAVERGYKIALPCKRNQQEPLITFYFPEYRNCC